MRKLSAILVVLLFAVSVNAGTTIKLGTATGGMMVYYNNIDVSGAGGFPDGIVSGYDEKPYNVAYTKAQNGYSDTKGMYFQFDSTPIPGLGTENWNNIFSGQPVGQSQFKFDLLAKALTYNPLGGVVVPGMSFVDFDYPSSTTYTQVIPPSDAAWAINNYQGGTPINSLLRGTGITLTYSNLQPIITGSAITGYTMDLAGELTTDGFIHWYYGANGTTDMTTWGLTDVISLNGTLAYNMIGDFGVDQRDFYAGSIDFYVTTVPVPGAILLGGIGISLVGWLRRRQTL